MGFKKDYRTMQSYKTQKCYKHATKYPKTKKVNTALLYAHSNVCPYFDVHMEQCTLNACIRGGVEYA